eukprot:NODE_1779_length_1070_cov_34.449559_g1451_i0.p3 GENE.NODE_1779_length_1070_cov_34.449559_g1451_i0~~NODE_1779_length_1070_cov_34.449559_g1451_i0.p3  ORF type:complete len:78 (+),score=25.43 NODE_1779_length_1070_cov_34.449559_g1451_i0:702-935(+)
MDQFPSHRRACGRKEPKVDDGLQSAVALQLGQAREDSSRRDRREKVKRKEEEKEEEAEGSGNKLLAMLDPERYGSTS